ncbi:MAG: class I SAM-dependent methyltransferase family protein [Candidatus Altiarchaeota archaeon]
MKYLKVRREDAESVRRKLLEKSSLDKSKAVERDGEYVMFPLLSTVKIPGTEVVEAEGRIKTKRPASLAESLSGILSADELEALPSSFNVIGDIVVLEPEGIPIDKMRLVGEAFLRTFRNIKVVALKVEQVSGEYRVPQVKVIAGEKRTETIHREHGCVYKLDIAKAYFSPRLGSERLRVVNQIHDGERVLVMFAGVGPYAILAAKLSGAEVTAIELNPIAVEYMRWNILRNKVNVNVIEGDVREKVPALGLFDRIIMPLPKQADTFLDVAFSCLKKDGVIHYYTFARNTLEATGHLAEAVGSLGVKAEILDVVLCGSYSPRISRLCVDFKVL